jgi:glycosyltransferase involved in cell wall biosynthesis
MGHRVTFLSTRHPAGHSVTSENEIAVHFLPGTPFGARRHGWGRESARRFAELHAREPFDLVWSQSFDAFGLARRRQGTLPPMVATIHGSLPQEIRTLAMSLRTGALPVRTVPAHALGLGFSYFLAHRPVLAKAAKIIAVCDRVRRDLHRWFGTAIAAKCVVIHNGIDVAQFAPDPTARARRRAALRIHEDAPVLLSLGRLTPNKGHQVALEALAQLRRAGLPAMMLLVGDGPYADCLRKAACRLGVADAVRFIGPVDHEITAEYYNSADAFLMPTLTIEAAPFVLMEAMACGTPVIASGIGGIGEVVQHTRSGILVPPGDVGCLAAELRGLLDDAVRRRALGEAGRRLVTARFSLDRMIRDTCAVFESVASCAAGGR